MIDAFQSIGHVMVNETVKTAQMKQTALRSRVNLECSNAKTTKRVYRAFEFAMVSLTVTTNLTKVTVTVHAESTHSNVNLLADVYPTLGSAMEMTTVRTVVMKTHQCVTIVNVILKRNSDATTASAFLNSGFATSKMIAVIIRMNLLIDVGTKIAQQVGENARLETITDAFRHGYSAMAKMIVAMALTNQILTIVRNAMKLVTSSVKTVDAYH